MKKLPLNCITLLIVFCTASVTALSITEEKPELVIERTVSQVLNKFLNQRSELEKDRKRLYSLVDELVSPLFDFAYISKLILAQSWKSASNEQKKQFAEEFKKLLIITYATALFQYTGEEKMVFKEGKVRERKGVLFTKVHSEVTLIGDNSVPVEYALIQNKQKQWKIYNLTVGDLNMVLNYRNVIQSSIRSKGLDEIIVTMKANNDKNY